MDSSLRPATILLLLASFAASGHAIVRRHDRPDQPYLDLAQDYPAVCDVGSDGNGTLIRSDWVLTASHVAAGLTPFSARVSFGGTTHGSGERVHLVDRVVLHPRYGPGSRGPANDIALLHLAEPVEGIAPVGLHRGREEAGRDIVFVGNGMSGLGNEGASQDDGLRRAATNRVHEVREDTLEFVFRRPEEAGELEGFWAGGDSGGPVFIESDGVTRIAGVASFGGDANGNGRHPDYGDRDVSYRVSSYVDWIEETLASEHDAGSRWSVAGPLDEGQIEDERAAALFAEYMDARSSGDRELRGFFEDTWLDPESIEVQQRSRDLWLADDLPLDLGLQRVVGFARRANDSEYAMLVRSPYFDEALCFLFRFSDEDPERLAGVRMQPLPDRILAEHLRAER